MRARPLLSALAGLGASLAAASPAHAVLCGSILNPLTITASNISFGDYIATADAPEEATGTISLSCALGLDVGLNFTVALSTGVSGSYAPRRMAQGASRLSYNLYTDQNHTIVWGNGSGGTVTQSFSSNLFLNTPVSFTVYGLAPAGQWSRAGPYQDTIVITVTY